MQSGREVFVCNRPMVMAGIRNSHARPPVQKKQIWPKISSQSSRRLIAALCVACGTGPCCSSALPAVCDAQRSSVSTKKPTEDGRGWIEILDKGMLVTLRGKTGWREVEVGRGSADATRPVTAVETGIKFAKLADGPLFRRVTGQGKAVGLERLNDKEVARLVKRTAMAAGVRGDLSEIERAFKFSGHSLRAGLASSAEVDERYVQKQLGHASAEATRRYQRRRDRFRVNLTKVSGL